MAKRKRKIKGRRGRKRGRWVVLRCPETWREIDAMALRLLFTWAEEIRVCTR